MRQPALYFRSSFAGRCCVSFDRDLQVRGSHDKVILHGRKDFPDRDDGAGSAGPCQGVEVLPGSGINVGREGGGAVVQEELGGAAVDQDPDLFQLVQTAQANKGLTSRLLAYANHLQDLNQKQ